MSEVIISQLDRVFANPLETNRQVNFISDRDAISALRRWEGMQVYVKSELTTYELRGGILNEHWTDISGVDSANYTPTGGYAGTAQDIIDSIQTVTGGFENISITHIANLDYYVIADPYKINANYYSAAPTTVTLTVGDATNARIDVIYADINGLIGVLTGTPSVTPVKPIVSNSQRELTFRTVPALATVDPLVTNIVVFDENVGTASGEFDVDGWNLTALNFNSTAVAFSGTKSIYFDGVDPYFNVDFKNDVNIPIAGFSTFFFRIYVTEVLDKNASLFFHILDTSFIANGNYLTVKSGVYGFDRNVLNAWQLISIPVSAFNLTITEIKGIRFMVSSIKKPKMYLDTLTFQSNLTQPTPTIAPRNFLQLTDTPTTYAGQSLKVARVNVGETALEFDLLDKNDVGLSNLDNTSDANKPVSTAQQTALNLKQNTLVSATNIKTINGISVLGSGNLVTSSVTQSTGNIIDLSNVIGTYYNMITANSATTYTFVNEIVGGKAIVLINAESEPVITGATKTKGYIFAPNEYIYMTVWYNGNRVEYYFTEITNETIIDLTGLPFGAIIAESPTPLTDYYGTPCILKSTTGRYIFSHDIFGSGTDTKKTKIYVSDNIDSNTWVLKTTLTAFLWGTLFEYSGSIYIIGVSNYQTGGAIKISKSIDDGETWSAPVTILGIPTTYDGWITAAKRGIIKDGYFCKAFDLIENSAGETYAQYFNPTLVFGNLADLTNPANWTYSNVVPFNKPSFLASKIQSDLSAVSQPTGGNQSKGFFEGGLVQKSNGDLMNVLRLHQNPASNYGVYLDITWDALTPTTSVLGSTHNFIEMPGGNIKSEPIYDAISGKHWNITNVNKCKRIDDNRMETYLISSSDNCLTWDVHEKVSGYDLDIDWETKVNQYATQYPSFIIDGNDIIAVHRTANIDANTYHDNNLVTITKVLNFRTSPLESVVDGALIIDENSERIENVNGISIIKDRSKYYNSPFMLTADNAAKVDWANGLNFTGTEYMRIIYDRNLSLEYNGGITFFVVIENIQNVDGTLRILSNDNGTDQEIVAAKGGWWISPDSIGIENNYAVYNDMTIGNNYMVAFSFDHANSHIYSYLNGVNRGDPITKSNTTWATDHLVLSSPYSGTNFKEIWMGRRNIGVSKLYFTSKIKALHIMPGYMTPAQMISYMNGLNAIYAVY